MSAKLYCSFCGKTKDEVFALLAGPTVLICDECVATCLLTLAERGYGITFTKPAKAGDDTPILRPSEVSMLVGALDGLAKALHRYSDTKPGQDGAA